MTTRGELIRPLVEPAGLIMASPAARLAAVPAPRGGQSSPAQVNAISPISLLRALRRRSALALGVALLLTAIASPAAWFLLPYNYKAQARLHVAALPPKVLFTTLETQTAGDDYRRYQSTQQGLVKSDLVLAAAVRDPKVSGYQMIREAVDPVTWLQEKLRVEFASQSELMEISLSGPNPEEVAGIVNAVKKAYMDEVVNVDLKRRTERFDQLNKYKEMYTDLLKKKRETMRKLAESVGSDDRQTLALRQQYALEHLHYLQKELLDLRSQRRKYEAQLRALRRGEPDREAEPADPSPQELDRLVEEWPAVAGLVAELGEREHQLEAARANARRLSRNHQNDPTVQALVATVRDLKKQLDRRRREVRPEVIRQARQEAIVSEDTDGVVVVQQLAMLEDLERRLNEEIGSISLVNQKMTTNTLDLQGMQEEVAQMEGAANKISQEVEALKIELEAPPRIRKIDDAIPPRTRDDKKRLMLFGMITLGSFFGGLLGIAFLELQARKVDTAEEIPLELGLPVVGALPILPARNQRPAAIDGPESEKDRYWRNVLLESVDATRTLLLHAARTGSYRVMMITSAVGGEGKTSLASYLATSLGRTGLRTLLIDADLRSPMMHKLFDRPPTPGLSELLRGEVDLDEALGATPVPDLTLLAAGRCDRQALRVLSQGGIAPLFDRLKERFDFIIVDTSPILPVADAMMIAQNVDAAIFSIFREISRKGKIKAACDRLQRLGVPVLGAVVTGVHGGHYGNEYYDADSSYRGLPESVAPAPAT